MDRQGLRRHQRRQRFGRCAVGVDYWIHRCLVGVDDLLRRVEEHIVVVVHVDRDDDGRHIFHKQALVLQFHLHKVLAVKRGSPCGVLEDPDPVLKLEREVRLPSVDLLEAAIHELDLAQVELEALIVSLLGRDDSLLLQFDQHRLLIVAGTVR